MRYAERKSADPNHQLLAKNFPGDITIDQIRGYFQQFGTLEDVQITFGHDGPGEKQPASLFLSCSFLFSTKLTQRCVAHCWWAPMAGTALITYSNSEAVQQAVVAFKQVLEQSRQLSDGSVAV